MEKRVLRYKIFIFLWLVISGSLSLCSAEGFLYRLSDQSSVSPQANTLIGEPRTYVVQKGDTLLDVARRFDLGFLELQDLHRDVDPWIPPEGTRLVIPTQWILPEWRWSGIVINVPEMRLYFFDTEALKVWTFPIGIGETESSTPVGTFHVVEKKLSPTWHIPPSLREKYEGKKEIPPGPENPLGSHWLGLSQAGYGIHGTNFPWAVGRLVTHGCIRLYPEDILRLFQIVPVGTAVEILYDPVKIGFRGERIFIEVHEDLYGRIPDLHDYTMERLRRQGLHRAVNPDKLEEALRKRDGLPMDISADRKTG